MTRIDLNVFIIQCQTLHRAACGLFKRMLKQQRTHGLRFIRFIHWERSVLPLQQLFPQRLNPNVYNRRKRRVILILGFRIDVEQFRIHFACHDDFNLSLL